MHEIIIEPHSPAKQLWQELWTYRELVCFLAWRDILIRYKQTIIGIAWSLIRPLSAILIFTIIFGRIAKLPSGQAPYPLLVYTAMLPWQFFSATVAKSSDSLLSNANLLSKIYFPRIIIPSVGTVVNMIDFLISFTILIGFMIWYAVFPDWKILCLPFFLGLSVLTALGLGYWFSALNVKYRDFRYIVPFITQFGLYISPVGFSSHIIPERWRLLYSMNPMVGVIDGFRWALLGEEIHFYLPAFIFSIGFAFSLFASGLWFFHHTERQFADFI